MGQGRQLRRPIGPGELLASRVDSGPGMGRFGFTNVAALEADPTRHVLQRSDLPRRQQGAQHMAIPDKLVGIALVALCRARRPAQTRPLPLVRLAGLWTPPRSALRHVDRDRDLCRITLSIASRHQHGVRGISSTVLSDQPVERAQPAVLNQRADRPPASIRNRDYALVPRNARCTRHGSGAAAARRRDSKR